ncbi:MULTISPECIES: hypothetical protein [unclassified Bradyrhizobium]|uniref:hypothetical protein n=1 Tax=unclassified Bradyrhizobium TaxID=2631580 RepID=UPI0028E6EB5F|nr:MULTISPECIES: hypothetical protein [unclassified Bradyrhizobium]
MQDKGEDFFGGYAYTRSGHPADLEIIITETPAHLRKFHDPESGLALIRPDAWRGPSDSSDSSPDTAIRKQPETDWKGGEAGWCARSGRTPAFVQ